MTTNWAPEGFNAAEDRRPQVILVFQGGGALGSYQAGVYQALSEASINPDWVIGTSIGAINACLIAGNAAENRVARLREFWDIVRHQPNWLGAERATDIVTNYWSTLLGGVPGFFKPNVWANLNPHLPLQPESAGYYSTQPLEQTLSRLADFDRMKSSGPRITVGAANVRTSRMKYFDSRTDNISVRHILASGALPPAFPPIRIDDELYWDGGILSNSPTEIVFEDNPRKDALIFSVNVWNPAGEEPRSMWDVLHRQKDVQYSSRMANHIKLEKQTHQLRRIISKLEARLASDVRDEAEIKKLASYGCVTRMHVIELLAPKHESESFAKDVDFSSSGIERRWEAGYRHTRDVLERKPWAGQYDPLEGVIVHERVMQ